LFLHAFRRQSRISEPLQSVQLRATQSLQVDAGDMHNRRCGIASDLHLVTMSLRMQFAHQPLAGIESDPAIIGFQPRIVSDL